MYQIKSMLHDKKQQLNNKPKLVQKFSAKVKLKPISQNELCIYALSLSVCQFSV